MAQIAIRRETSQDSVDREITGVPTYSKIIDIIDSRLGSSEFYEIVPARVLKVYSEEADLPIVTVKDKKKPNWSLLYSIDVEVIEDGRIINNIYPLSINFIQLPVVDEVVNLTAHAGTIYYSAPVNLENDVTVNTNVMSWRSQDNLDLKVSKNLNSHNRKSYSHHGDTILQGKFGQHIIFSGYPDDTGRYVSPAIFIGSNQFNDKNQLTYKEDDIHMPHIHNINSFGSAIEISSGNYVTKIEPAFIDFENLLKPPKLWGDQIVVNSDRIIINAKRDTIRNRQSGDIHFFAGRNVNIGATEEINLEITPGDNTSKITLADANSVNPLVKGTELLEMLESLISKVIKFANTVKDEGAVDAEGKPIEDFEAVSKKTLGPAAKELMADLQIIRGKFLTPTVGNKKGKIFSNKIYIG
jgi:hypothetical protein